MPQSDEQQQSSSPEPDVQLDARNLNCPLPILRAKKALNAMQLNEVLEVTATDPGAVMDFEAFCKQTDHQLLEHSESDGEFRFLLRKG